MRNLFILVLSITVLALVFAGCEREGDGSLQVSPTAPDGFADKSGGDYLATLWEAGDLYAYDSVSGTIDIDVGGSFTDHPASYPDGFVVSVAVPPGAVPAEYADNGRITITVKVPQYGTAFVSPDDACPVIFEPHGVQFRRPINIWLVLPQGLAERCDEGYLFYNLEKKTLGGVDTFTYRDTSHVHSVAGSHESVAPPGYPGPNVVGGCRNLIRCEVLHFSRWEVEGGGCDEPGCED
jgi:hypothetical protein